MALSFTSKSIQTAREDGTFDEKPLETTDEPTVARAKPLFEQLRDKQTKAEQERIEEERAAMRGTHVLNADEKSHLESVYKQKKKASRAKEEQLQQDMADFQAARALRQEPKKENDTVKDVEGAEEVKGRKLDTGCVVVKKKRKVETSKKEATEAKPALTDLLAGYSDSSEEE